MTSLQDVPLGAWTAIVAVVGAVGGWIAKRGPNRADAAATLTNAGVALVNELQEQNMMLRDEIGELRAENRSLHSKVSDLKRQVDRLQSSIDRLAGD